MRTFELTVGFCALLGADGLVCAAQFALTDFNPPEESEKVETRLRTSFDASKESKTEPKHGELVSGLDLTGTWQSPGGYDSTSLTFKPDPDGGYSVEFSTMGCVGGWKLSRTATYSGSIVQLNLPVQEYVPAQYTRLYSIGLGGEFHLIASARVSRFNERAAEDESALKHYLLSRQKQAKEKDT